jgi:hypothetical protein
MARKAVIAITRVKAGVKLPERRLKPPHEAKISNR